MEPGVYPLFKRAFDLFSAVCAAVVLAPVLLAIAVMVKLNSPGPAIHWSRRIGRDNEEFRMAKFRTMRVETPQVATHLMADSQNYVTSIGGFLRRTSLDELPQLLNIVRGEISFVGPRPALYNQHDLIASRTSVGVHRIPPGLTGWAQISGRDELPIPVKVEHDRHYLENRSFLFDLKILLMTFFKVLRTEGVSH